MDCLPPQLLVVPLFPPTEPLLDDSCLGVGITLAGAAACRLVVLGGFVHNVVFDVV